MFNTYIFPILGVAFATLFLFFFSPEVSASCNQGILEQFLLHCTCICMTSKSVSWIFKILFQAGDISIFVFRGVFFSRYFQLKSSFSDEENISGKILRHTLVEKLSNFNAERY